MLPMFSLQSKRKLMKLFECNIVSGQFHTPVDIHVALHPLLSSKGIHFWLHILQTVLCTGPKDHGVFS